MATSNPLKGLLDTVLCSLCQESFKHPVLLKCGHNFCRACITRYCEDSQSSSTSSYTCPQCGKGFRKGEFQPNWQLKHVADVAKTIPEPGGQRACNTHNRGLKLFCEVDQTLICLVCRESQDHKEHAVVPIEEAAQDYKCQIQHRLANLEKEKKKILSYKSSGKTTSQELLKQLQIDRQKIASVFQRLCEFLEEQEQLLLDQLEELKKEIEKRRDEYVAKLSEELSSFSSLISEMEQKFQQPASEFLQDISGTLCRCERKPFQNPVAFSSDLKWRLCESSQKAASLEVLMKKFKDTLASRLLFHKANVTLDPDTAHPLLVLSEDRRRVRCEHRQQRVPDTPERFDTERCVLGREGFTSGCHYWEVEVELGDGGFWAVGVARDSVSRKGWVDFSPEQGVWAVQGQGNGCWALTAPGHCTPLPKVRAPHRVRVYLDYEGGRVALYDAGSGESIFTFPPAPFAGERIRPFFLCVGCVVLGGMKAFPLHSPWQLFLCP
ncbi:tripartite motif-containing protein 10-like [Pelodiscus sinensis]|uniref:tripartite motif-containing protein 10-like n=1 Tax=Pelodiscus sinensis TaxID=13735 RepID=UPI003F6B0A5D